MLIVFRCLEWKFIIIDEFSCLFTFSWLLTCPNIILCGRSPREFPLLLFNVLSEGCVSRTELESPTLVSDGLLMSTARETSRGRKLKKSPEKLTGPVGLGHKLAAPLHSISHLKYQSVPFTKGCSKWKAMGCVIPRPGFLWPLCRVQATQGPSF